MSLGISYQDEALKYQQSNSARLQRNGSNYVKKGQKAASATKAGAEGDVLSLSHNSGCTDGKDDGKIGLFSAIGNAVVGAGKSIVNGIKGCFTDSEGKFSLTKTLTTVAMGAACIAFPAVGLAACCIGATMGGVQVAKGAFNAMNAKTDAEAKEAWQNIGAGGVTVASSVAGAKASYGAVKGTSTAAVDDVAKAAAKALDKTDDVAGALSNIDDASELGQALSKLDNVDDVKNALNGLDNVDDAVKAIGNQGQMAKGNSALAQLDDTATWGEKATALGKDMASSTKNRAGAIKTGIEGAKDANKNYKDAKADFDKKYTKEQQKAYDDFKNADDALQKYKAEHPDATGDSDAALKELATKRTEATKALADKGVVEADYAADLQTVADAKSKTVTSQAKNSLKQQMEDRKAAKEARQAQKKAITDAKEAYGEKLKGLTGEQKTAYNEYLKVKANDEATAAEIAEALNKAQSKGVNVAELDTAKEAIATAQEAAKAAKISSSKLAKVMDELKNSDDKFAYLKGQAKEIAAFLKDENNTYAQAVSKYGYDNVAQVIETVAAYRLADEAV